MNDKVTLMKGNEALAVAAIRYGADGYFGYPITPQSEVLEKLEEPRVKWLLSTWCMLALRAARQCSLLPLAQASA